MDDIIVTISNPLAIRTVIAPDTPATATISSPGRANVSLLTPGPPGPPNILTIGTVVRGDDASATIEGTSPAQVLSLVLPKGDQGSQYTDEMAQTAAKADGDITDAISKKHSNSLDHSQGTDQGLDTGGENAVTAAQAKTGYSHSQSTHAPSDATRYTDEMARTAMGSIGNDTEILYNDDGAIAGDASHVWDKIHQALKIGNLPVLLPDNPLAITGNVDSYLQTNFRNKNSNSNASADHVLTADDGDDSTNYADFGICNSTYLHPSWPAMKPHDTYLYGQGAPLNDPGQANLLLGTDVDGGIVKIYVKGIDDDHLRAMVDDKGVNLPTGMTYRINDANIFPEHFADYEDIWQDEIDCGSAGWISGGAISRGTTGTISVAAGVVKLWDGMKFVRVAHSAYTNQSPYGTGYNYISFILNPLYPTYKTAVLSITPTEQNDSTHVPRGSFYVDAGSGHVNVLWPYSPEAISDFPFKVNARFNIWKTIVDHGFEISEQAHPNELKVSIAAGTLYFGLNEIPVGSSTSFFKLLTSSDRYPLSRDIANDNNTIDTTLWADVTKTHDQALTVMTDTYWAKGLFVVSLEGAVQYIYPTAEYATEDLAKAALRPFEATLIADKNATLFTIVFQKGDTSIANRFYDVRPMFSRLFGQETPSGGGTAISWNQLLDKPFIPTELSDLSDDTTHRLVTDAEKSTWNAKQAALVAGTDYATPAQVIAADNATRMYARRMGMWGGL